MPQFMTIPEVAKVLRLGQRTVYTLAREGRIGGVIKVGNQWRFDHDGLMAWLKAGGDAPLRKAGVPARHGRTTALKKLR